jgi:hypothetical protein
MLTPPLPSLKAWLRLAPATLASIGTLPTTPAILTAASSQKPMERLTARLAAALHLSYGTPPVPPAI